MGVEKLCSTCISKIIRNRYTFISYNGLTQDLVNSVKKGFDDSFVVINASADGGCC